MSVFYGHCGFCQISHSRASFLRPCWSSGFFSEAILKPWHESARCQERILHGAKIRPVFSIFQNTGRRNVTCRSPQTFMTATPLNLTPLFRDPELERQSVSDSFEQKLAMGVTQSLSQCDNKASQPHFAHFPRFRVCIYCVLRLSDFKHPTVRLY